mmetsp:Transcript_67962/g.196793  ORF Transcript_67962/g.196793 Transcript_67962/m.196793 type:complete len:259 (-) Transcript_67962:45-821(-)
MALRFDMVMAVRRSIVANSVSSSQMPPVISAAIAWTTWSSSAEDLAAAFLLAASTSATACGTSPSHLAQCGHLATWSACATMACSSTVRSCHGLSSVASNCRRCSTTWSGRRPTAIRNAVSPLAVRTRQLARAASSVRTVSSLARPAAYINGVCPRAVVLWTSARRSMNHSAKPSSRSCAAKCNAVLPLAFPMLTYASGSQPGSRRHSSTLAWISAFGCSCRFTTKSRNWRANAATDVLGSIVDGAVDAVGEDGFALG